MLNQSLPRLIFIFCLLADLLGTWCFQFIFSGDSFCSILILQLIFTITILRITMDKIVTQSRKIKIRETDMCNFFIRKVRDIAYEGSPDATSTQ